ncbi:unnamed protein product, partial [Allacma fusca]
MDTARNQDWVISGMSGRFPESENLEIFWDNLRKGKDMVSENDERWERNAYDIPLRTGKIPSIDKFDASFFGVSGTQAHRMDPKTRTALEVAYEAIVDAGVNPKSLDGSPVGVFMASSFSEAVDIWIRSNENPTGHYMSGCHPSMLADRISYAFNFNGPSCVFDSGCSASFSALQYAVLALKSGVCESAIVGGANINLLPLLSKSFVNFNAISADGKCKVFDASCDGYVRSEAVVALYICRGDRAKRSYATIAAIKCLNDGYKPEGVSMPSVEMQAQLIKNLYVEAGVNPLEVAYVEAHGTGTKAGDPKEIEALAQVFCKGRKEPLLVGSVKSNMGHPEPVSGLCGIVKVLLSRRAGILPPNLHYTTPNPECPALVDGRIQVVTTESPFSGNVVGVSSFGIGGTSGHLVLRFENERTCADTETTSPLSMAVVPLVNGLQSPDPYIKLSFDSAEWKHARESTTNEDIPTLILASGRTNEAVEHFLKESTSVSTNNDFVGLLHEITKIDTARHSFLGYAIKASPVNCEFVIAEKPETQKSMCISWDVPHHKNEISGSHSAKFIISTSAAREYSGIQIHGFKPTTLASSKEISKPTITVQKFIPYFDPPEVTVSMEEAIEFFLMIVVDNSFPDFDDKFVFTEILEDAPSNRPYLQPLLYLHFVSLEHRIVGTKRSDDSISCNNCQNYNDIRDLKPLAKSHCIWIDHEDKIRPCLDLLLDNGFIMLSTSTEGIDKDLNIVASKRIQNEMFYLLRKATRLPSNATLVAIDSSNFTWVENLRN